MKTARFLTIALSFAALSTPAFAVPFSIMVGDDDGYGFGALVVPDNGAAPWTSPPYDGRSGAEAIAVDGAQMTDIYSSIFPGSGPNPVGFGNVFMPLPAVLLSGTLTIDMGDFQSSTFGPILANINGVSFSFAFDDGFQKTAVRSFVLDPTMIANANFVSQVILSLDRNGSGDYIAFDNFRLDAEVVPEPGTLLLLGSGLTGLAMRRKRRNG